MRLVSVKMLGRGLLALTILSTCVLSLPLTPSQLENEDVKVMKCIVEALADVLSRPHPMPVSQECLVTLKTDDRLVSILRHHNFLKELQEIAVQGGQERAELQRDAGTPDPLTQTPQATGDVADRSMLEALGGPGERSILSQKRRHGDGEEGKEESLGDEESREDSDIAEEVQVKRGNEERPASHGSESADEGSEGKAEKREEEEEEYEEKRADLEESSEENMIKDEKAAGSGERRNKSKEKKKSDEEDEEDRQGKRSALFSHKQEEKQQQEEEEEEDEGEMKRGGSRESLKRWSKRGKALPLKRKAGGKEAQQLNSQQEVPHHSKEVSEEEEEKKKRHAQRSPEEKELQMIARRGAEDRRGSEEEGSASRKSEEPEIESLAAIESELENVAQKLHELRRG